MTYLDKLENISLQLEALTDVIENLSASFEQQKMEREVISAFIIINQSITCIKNEVNSNIEIMLKEFNFHYTSNEF